ncbi:hypothetical protein H5410_005253 [Solanum commersonii]|uniref:Uncharacterized protein n=1 Tax=Solanum commersonii TaxID=4109 RepID=A0A9J6A6X3_SOLCO|nr:hypothetical protein H5410_005253 [Solanum commersonii]
MAKKKSRRPINPEDIAGSISSAPERISHDTHLFAVPFGTTNPRQYYPNYRRPTLPSRRYEDLPLHAIHRAQPLSAGTPSPTGSSPQLSSMRLGDSSSEQSDAMVGMPPLTQCFMHLDVSPSSTATPSATPHDTMWHPTNDVARALKDCVRRLYTQAYHSWSEIPKQYMPSDEGIRQTMLKKVRDSGERPGWMLPHVFDELGQYWNTEKFKAKTVGTIAREMEKELGRTPIEPEVFKKTHNDFHQYVAENLDNLERKVVGGTHKGRCYGLSSRNDVRRLHSGIEDIGSSRQAEALDGVQIVVMSDQIAKLTAALAESKRRRVAEQESMSETVQQIKEQVMNLAHRPTTSAPNDTDDESDEDYYVDLTP